MKAVHELGGPQVKRMVLLGSAVSVLDSFQDMSVAGADYTEKDWNPVSLQHAQTAGNMLIRYLGHRRVGHRVKKCRPGI